jgi:hypothetical protein
MTWDYYDEDYNVRYEKMMQECRKNAIREIIDWELEKYTMNLQSIRKELEKKGMSAGNGKRKVAYRNEVESVKRTLSIYGTQTNALYNSVNELIKENKKMKKQMKKQLEIIKELVALIEK